MAIAFRRSVRQLVCFVIAGAAAYGTWFYTREARIFHAFQGGGDVWPAVSAVAAFFLAFLLANTFIKGRVAH